MVLLARAKAEIVATARTPAKRPVCLTVEDSFRGPNDLRRPPTTIGSSTRRAAGLKIAEVVRAGTVVLAAAMADVIHGMVRTCTIIVVGALTSSQLLMGSKTS